MVAEDHRRSLVTVRALCGSRDTEGLGEPTAETFGAAVPPRVRSTLYDSERIAPFANIEVQAGIRKRHGMAGYKKERANKIPSCHRQDAREVPSDTNRHDVNSVVSSARDQARTVQPK